ncbi:DUF4397 domain-containing protein [Chitinophaga eiseniae]|uniref:DUF4397 domain-containing protein n=1 Tax=Chitinophaga eiseniae TaxID=634771 RepID=A0A847SMK0_9BACT|nr:DUF4397 domain-containing protein [Chitinophaga eiseniae]NLR81414.1 DUF4397 domain-containing protein [Chitinophaga eiseniae]
MNKRYYIFLLLPLLGLLGSCRKTEYASIQSPAYLRVFNCLDYTASLDNKDAPQPFLTFMIDPATDENGIPVSAAVTGDFLDHRDDWAMPYPDAASNVIWQKEFPGTKRVLAAPVLNGYDLSSWAQVPSGKHRVIFRTRPLNNTPYFELDKQDRGVTLIDTTIDLTAGEVYTMHALVAEYASKQAMMYLRNETFPKQPFADDQVYVNCYNLSAKGFFELSANTVTNEVLTSTKLRDTMNVYYTLARRGAFNAVVPMPGYKGIPMGQIYRSLESKVAPYFSFPLFADSSSNKIFTGNMMQQFSFYATGFSPENMVFPDFLAVGAYSSLLLGDFGDNPNRSSYYPFLVRADLRTGLIVSIHSGTNNPRSFATVNTIEYINRRFYVTTVQRKYAPPVY